MEKVDALVRQSANTPSPFTLQFHRRPLAGADKRDSRNEHLIVGAINFNRFQFERTGLHRTDEPRFSRPLTLGTVAIFAPRLPWIQGPFLKVITRCARLLLDRRLLAIPNRNHAH